MKKILLFLISLFIGLAVLGLVSSQVGIEKISQALSLFPNYGLALVILLAVLIALVGIWRWKFILKKQGYDLPFLKLGPIWTAGFAITFLTPIAILGGEVFMIYSLRKLFSISWEKSISSVFINRILDATIFFPLLLLGILIFPTLTGFLPVAKVLIVGGAMTALLGGLLAVFYFKSFKKESVLKWIFKFFGIKPKSLESNRKGRLMFDTEKEVIRFFGLREGSMWKGIGISVLKYSLFLVQFWFIIYFFGGGTSILRTISIYGFHNLACLVPIPAMLGSLEVAESLVFEGLGLGANLGVAFSFLVRGINLLICLVGFLFLIKFGAKIAKIKILGLIKKLISDRSSLFLN